LAEYIPVRHIGWDRRAREGRRPGVLLDNSHAGGYLILGDGLSLWVSYGLGDAEIYADFRHYASAN
jgi:hypothetical protein